MEVLSHFLGDWRLFDLHCTYFFIRSQWPNITPTMNISSFIFLCHLLLRSCMYNWYPLIILSILISVYTHDGNSDGSPCVFPFTWQGETYTSCFKKESLGDTSLKCATTANYDTDGRWGKCSHPSILHIISIFEFYTLLLSKYLSFFCHSP